MSWTPVCALSRLPLERGVAALVDGYQVAVFRVGDVVHAVDNRDPATGAMVMSRGLVGSRGDRLTVASPLHKQVYDLETGRCLDDDALALAVHEVQLLDGALSVRLSTAALDAAV